MHTIVIADDNISFAEEMRNYFTNNTDFKVVGIAPDGVEAIKLVEKTQARLFTSRYRYARTGRIRRVERAFRF